MILATVTDFFTDLASFNEQIPLDRLSRWLHQTPISYDDVQPFLRFHPGHYVRNLMFAGPAFHALVLCWRNGQRSPIHDHQGSACAVKVLKGSAMETIFERAPNGMIYATRSRQLNEGGLTASQDADIHQISNLQAAGADLVTLHVYSPPLLCMNLYSLLDASVSQFVDPINAEFAGGDGI
jgi:cysteine dioxygenase